MTNHAGRGRYRVRPLDASYWTSTAQIDYRRDLPNGWEPLAEIHEHPVWRDRGVLLRHRKTSRLAMLAYSFTGGPHIRRAYMDERKIRAACAAMEIPI